MAYRLGTWVTWLFALTFVDTVASAGKPVGFFEVVTVTPSRVINHEVDLKGPFDDDVTETILVGPERFSHTVDLGKKAVHSQKAYHNWYKISRPINESQRSVTVRDPLRGNAAQQITVENAAFLLSPSQRVTTGPPSPVPEGLNYFKAYQIVDGPRISQQVRLTGTFGPEERTATTAVLFCVPVDEWHHDEHFPVKNSQDCMLVYELEPHEKGLSITTIDQFGLNKLEAHSSKWLCVPAELVSGSSE